MQSRLSALLSCPRHLRHSSTGPSKASTVDPAEIAKFAATASNWWHPDGSAAPLHRMNPTRLAYIRSVIEKYAVSHRPIPAQVHATKPLAGIDVVDVGCGGGLVTEPVTRLGANVLGIDMSKESLKVAKYHASMDPDLSSSHRLQYKEAAVEDLAENGDSFDAVLALEVIEHVKQPTVFLRSCASLVRPGGILVVSTLNRTVASYALGIVAAERILRWLPNGTHDWTKFPRPEEVSHVIQSETALTPSELVGIRFNLLSRTFSVVEDTSVNYILTATRPLAAEDVAGKKKERTKSDE
eukprot:GFKZ01005423.1.p1 GENE.GFKZ01005423.1~~GFKZ01005423.1.p1  ORF type:complete len:297 (-),score=33.32 GFKZ01005423.1:3576-4466(-)